MVIISVITYYYWFFNVIIALTILEALKLRVQILNKIIKTFQCDSTNTRVLRMTYNENMSNTGVNNLFPLDILDLIKVYLIVMKTVNIYNKLFGSFSSTMVFAILFQCISYVYRFLMFDTQDNTESMPNIVEGLVLIILMVSFLCFVAHLDKTVYISDTMDLYCCEMRECRRCSYFDD